MFITVAHCQEGILLADQNRDGQSKFTTSWWKWEQNIGFSFFVTRPTKSFKDKNTAKVIKWKSISQLVK